MASQPLPAGTFRSRQAPRDASRPAFERETRGESIVQMPEKRVKGIEPSPKAWEAFVLPLNYTRRTVLTLTINRQPVKRGRVREITPQA